VHCKSETTTTTAAKTWEEQMGRWRSLRRQSGADPASTAFWNGLDVWEAYERYTNYPGLLLQPILAAADPFDTVLDIGAGTGAFALPLAKRVRWVTAVEPSSVQCARLMRKAASMEVGNISVIQKDWNAMCVVEIEPHDIIVAAYCLFMEDIVAAIRKMHCLARRRVYLVHLAGHDLQDEIHSIRGKASDVPDHRLLLDVLKEMRIEATCQVFSRSFYLPLDLQLEMFRSAQGLRDSEVQRLKMTLREAGQIEKKDSQFWVRRFYEDALIMMRTSA